MLINNRGFLKKKRKRSFQFNERKGISPLNIKKASFFKMIFKLLNIILTVVIIYFTYFFFFSNYYNINDVQMTELEHTSTGEFLELIDNQLNNYKFFGIKTKNYFLYKSDTLFEAINKSYLFDNIEIKKTLPNHIFVKIAEKNVIYRIYSYENEYLLDDAGQIVKKISNFSNRPSILSINNKTQDIITNSTLNIYGDKISFEINDQFVSLFTQEDIEFNIGDFIIDKIQLKFISALIENNNYSFYKIKRIILPSKYPQYIEVATEKGWSAIFNTNDEYKTQNDKLKLIVDEQIGKSLVNKLDYVDLRLGNSIYYKYK